MLDKCFICGGEVEGFTNVSYYDFYTVRCAKCEYEFDFVMQSVALKYWNNPDRKELKDMYDSAKNKGSIQVMK